MSFEISGLAVWRVNERNGDRDEVRRGPWGYEVWPVPNMRVIIDKPKEVKELDRLFAAIEKP